MEKLFSKKDLVVLIVPLIIEQFLALGVGFIDSVMVASIGETAVSAVSLVDNINILLISIFAAMATGGAVIISQYTGRNDIENAKISAKQLVYTITFVALAVMLAVLIFNKQLLELLFGDTEKSVMNKARMYFYVTSVSYPFLALYNGGAAIFRSIGNSKVSMKISVYMNIINIVGNALCIYIFRWGVFGAAFATLVSRVFAAVMITKLVCNRKNKVCIEKLLHIEIRPSIIKKILRISIPNGVENGLFHFGKLAVVSIVATLGTSAIAANSVANSVANLACVPGAAMGYAVITVIGQCIGAGDYRQSEYFTKYLIKWTHIMFFAINAVFMITTKPMVAMYNLSGEAAEAAVRIIYLHNILSGFFWPLSFTFPNALRAAGDVKFTMITSMSTMWIFRVILSYVFVTYIGTGVEGIWYALYVDWLVRIAFFLLRFKSGKWKKNKAI